MAYLALPEQTFPNLQALRAQFSPSASFPLGVIPLSSPKAPGSSSAPLGSSDGSLAVFSLKTERPFPNDRSHSRPPFRGFSPAGIVEVSHLCAKHLLPWWAVQGCAISRGRDNVCPLQAWEGSSLPRCFQVAALLVEVF